MLSVVTWKWGSLFGPEYVNRLRSMLARHLHVEHRLFCVADTPAGIEEGTTVLPMWADHAEMSAGSRSCFRRLRMFDRGVAEVLGPRFLHLDLDVVIVGDITPLATRTEPILIYDQNAGSGAKKAVYNPSFLLMDAGVMHQMWEDFHADPKGVWTKAKAAGWSCSDMSVIGMYFDKVKPPTLGPKDGLVAYWRDVKPKGRLPEGARAVLFYGNDNPGDAKVQARNPWIKEHWGGARMNPAPSKRMNVRLFFLSGTSATFEHVEGFHTDDLTISFSYDASTADADTMIRKQFVGRIKQLAGYSTWD